MPSTAFRARLSLLVLALALVAGMSPAAVAANEPSGESVTLPDGTVLPPPPSDQPPSVHAEMLAENGTVAVTAVDGSVAGPSASEPGEVAPAAPLVQAESGAIGPGGPLPNGLRREVLGFLPYWKLDATTRSHLRFDLVSTVAYFSIGVQPNGYLARGPVSDRTVGWEGWTSSGMTAVIDAAHARGVKVVPTVTMMVWDGDYSGMSQLLNNATYRARLVEDIATVIRERNADGVNVDFEPVPTTLRSQFTTFIRELKAGLVARGVPSYLTVDTMAGAASWATGYDVVGLTADGAADALMVMAYDFSWSGSARAGGVAPLESDYIFASNDALRAHLARVPPGKLIWGIPYYGRAWNTGTADQNSPVRSPAQSVAFSYYWTDAGQPAGGKILAQQFGRRWDATGQVPWFAFRNSDGGWRQGYYDDPTSLRLKYDTVLSHGLAGIGIWHLGMDTGVPDLWNVIQDRFARTQTRLAGADRYATAAAISAASFAPGVPVAFVATGRSFPDALAGGPSAARLGGPVLLVNPDGIPSTTQAELRRLRPGRIVVLGGPGAVADSVVVGLNGFASGGASRVFGADRYATAAAVSATFFPRDVPVAYVATGLAFPDALTGGVAAGRQGGPLLLVRGDALPSSTADELARLRPSRIVVLGGTGAVSDSVLEALRPYAVGGTVTRLAGADRYATSVAISRATTADAAADTVYVATGRNFADGLAGTPAAARAGMPLLIVPPTGLTPAVADELRRLNPRRVVILGGTSAVPDGVARQIAALWD